MLGFYKDMTGERKGPNEIPQVAFERSLVQTSLFNICSVLVASPIGFSSCVLRPWVHVLNFSSHLDLILKKVTSEFVTSLADSICVYY